MTTKTNVNTNAIPQDLKDRRAWVVWKLEPRPDKPDELTKVPYRPDTGKHKARSNDRATWGTFEQALACYQNAPDDVTGVGICFDGDLCGVDLDKCADDGELEPWALAHVERLKTYTEWSPSGRGVHCLAWGELPEGGRRKGRVEMYDKTSPRFFTVTGDVWPGYERIEQRAGELAALHADVFGTNGSEPPTPMPTPGASSLDDADLLARARNAGNGSKFERLWNGDASGYPSQSEADLALCMMLAFWVDRDAGAIDRLFRQSGLMRDKWDERHAADGRSYGEMTIEKAMSETTETYTPGRSNGSTSTAASIPDPSDQVTDFYLSLPADDGGNAECVRRYASGAILYTDTMGWLYYNGQHFESDAQARVESVVKEVLRERRLAAVKADLEGIVKGTRQTRHNVTGAMFMLRSDVWTRPEDFDSEPHLLNCANGVLDLRTSELIPHSPEQRLTYCIPTAHNPNADRSAWLAFLDQVTGSQLMTRYLQEAVGYSLTGETSEEVMFYVTGPPRSGKGTFTETIMAALGKMPLATEVDIRAFTQSRSADSQNFALAPLRPCRFVAASESADNERLNGAKVKALTGGNYIYCANKGKDFFSYRPQFKIWLSSNYPVNADPDDDALWCRLRVIEFPTSFADREDKTLKRRMKAPANLEAVLAWAVEGAVRWYGRAEKGLFTPKRVREVTSEHREQQDFVGQWLREYIERTDNPDDFIPNEQLHGSYKAWCQMNGVTPKGLRTLTQTLNKKGYKAGAQKKVAGRNARGCKGVRFFEVEGNSNDK